jgi:hypothetical protein
MYSVKEDLTMTTKRNRATSPSSTSAPATPASQLENWPAASLDEVSNASQAYVNGVAAVNQEIADFLQTRLKHDIALGEALARCRTLAEATQAQGEWLKQATDDYTAETQKLFDLGSRLMRGGWTSSEGIGSAARTAAPRAAESQPK